MLRIDTAAAKAAPTKEAESAKKERSSKKESNFDLLETVIGTSMLLPTVQLFDAMWHRAFKWLESKSKNAVEYLQKQYFQILTPEVLRRQYLCSSGSWDRNHRHVSWERVWVTVHGKLPVELDKRKVKWDARASPLEIFAVTQRMQKLFREERRVGHPARVHYMARKASVQVQKKCNEVQKSVFQPFKLPKGIIKRTPFSPSRQFGTFTLWCQQLSRPLGKSPGLELKLSSTITRSLGN